MRNETEGGPYGFRGEVRNDSEPCEKGGSSGIETGCGQAVRKRLALEIERSECEPRRERDGRGGEEIAFPGLRRRVVNFENAQAGAKGIAIGKGVEARAEYDHLANATVNRGGQGIFRESRPDGDEEAHSRPGGILQRVARHRRGILAQDSDGERIGENAAVLQELMGRAMSGGGQRGAA